MKESQVISSSTSRTTCTQVRNSNHGSVLTILALTICLSVAPAFSEQVEETQATSPTIAEQEACNGTPYPGECLFSLSAQRAHRSSNTQESFLKAALQSSQVAVQEFKSFCSNISESEHSCVELLGKSEVCLNSSLSKLTEPSSTPRMNDVLTWLSASLTCHTTCMEETGDLIRSHGKKSMARAANSVSLASTVLLESSPTSGDEIPHRRLLSESSVYDMDGHYPEWMRGGVRHLLQQSGNLTSYNAVVAKDGSGNYTTVQAAVNQAPTRSNTTYIIKINEGIFNEVVNVPANVYNLMFVGDGINKTVITGSLSNRVDHITTFRTATVVIDGDGFVAKDITFRNTAGAENYQAVAVRVDSDKSAFSRCSFEGFQDTLYTHSLRQFYRDCSIYGTVDFIFGNSAAVFQSCNLVIRRPLIAQSNTVTAQARSSAAQNTGFSFQNCSVVAAPELAGIVTSPYNQSIQSFLGRPWQPYSRSVFMLTYMSPVINAEGWLYWEGTDFPLGTLSYSEYKNFGPGGSFNSRVSWATNITDPNVAAEYGIAFIQGEEWVPNTGIPFATSV